MKDEPSSSAFVEWVDGDRTSHLCAVLHEPHEQRREHALAFDESKMGRQLITFFRRYHAATTLMCALLLFVFAWVVITLPSFGDPDAPTNNMVPAEYLTHGTAETGAENVVTAMIFTYRGFDTLGESCVLFLALSSVMMLLLRHDMSSVKPKERIELAKAAEKEPKTRNFIVTQMSKILAPFIFLYGLYVLLGGESSPGGGFSAGAIMSAGIILYRHAVGADAAERFMNERLFVIIRTVGLCIYAVLFGVYILLQGGEGSSLTSHLIMPIDIAVGMVVMCTMYGFYALFTKGEI
ncbi:MAG: hypothetical protein IK136_06035 [Oscillospiraceae bacterium]|nr:hypothetical protein [Oscillospiraceae bacterium]